MTTSPRPGRLLEELGCSPTDCYALFGRIGDDTGSMPALQYRQADMNPARLPADLRIDVALVRPENGDVLESIAALLARLRDVHAGRVVVLADAIQCEATFFASLGFERRESPSMGGSLFAWDPEVADQPRAWNNADSWANPENFSKYRW